jgi:hypothetical protein
MCLRPKIRALKGFEAAVYNAGASTHMSPDKNPPTTTALAAVHDRKIATEMACRDGGAIADRSRL